LASPGQVAVVAAECTTCAAPASCLLERGEGSDPDVEEADAGERGECPPERRSGAAERPGGDDEVASIQGPVCLGGMFTTDIAQLVINVLPDARSEHGGPEDGEDGECPLQCLRHGRP
jgi:hypothetical protein